MTTHGNQFFGTHNQGVPGSSPGGPTLLKGKIYEKRLKSIISGVFAFDISEIDGNSISTGLVFGIFLKFYNQHDDLLIVINCSSKLFRSCSEPLL